MRHFKREGEVLVEHKRQAVLKVNPRGVVGTYRDDGQPPVTQTEWHIDHAPTLEEVLKRKTPRLPAPTLTRFVMRKKL